jgi:quercetin dioxygenase-like cupin family protein
LNANRVKEFNTLYIGRNAHKTKRMKNYLSIILPLIIWSNTLSAQEVKHLKELEIDETAFSNVHVLPLNEDSLSSTFIIWVKDEVKPHYHEAHTEVVYVLKGKGDMMLNDTWKTIKAGDYIFIPKGTKHAVKVTGDETLKVISIQSPRFDGQDRVLVPQY